MTETTVVPCFLSDLYHVLSAPRRCYAIQLLAQKEDQLVAVRDLSREITAIEQGVCVEEATGEPYRNVYNALSQTHLSTMADVGVLDYDQRRQEISPSPQVSQFDAILKFNRILILTLYKEGNRQISDSF